MSSFLSRVTSGVAPKPVRFAVHGHPGSGKTLLASGAPGCIFQTVEDGMGLIDAAQLPAPSSFSEAIAQIGELISEDHEYRSLVVDAIDGIEPLIFREICEAGGKESIADFGFNKGYVQADSYWVRYFKALDELRAQRSMHIVVISHSAAVHYDDPTTGTYVRWEPNLHKRTVPLLTKWADVIGFLDLEKTVVDRGDADKNRAVRTAMASGSRFLNLTETGSFIAKNRFGLKPQLEIPLENGWSVFGDALKAAYEKAAGTTNQKKQEAA